MNDCLVTKLRGKVENDNLVPFGAIRITTKPNNEGVVFGSFGPFSVSAPQPVLAESKGQTVGVTSLTYSDDASHNIYVIDGTSEVELTIKSKYDLKCLYLQAITNDVDVTYLNNLTHLREYTVGTGKVSGSLPESLQVVYLEEALSEITFDKVIPKLTHLGIKQSYVPRMDVAEFISYVPNATELLLPSKNENEIYGDFTEFGKLTKLILIVGTSTAGTIEEFVSKARSAGRTTGSVAFMWLGSINGVTFNGSPVYRGGTRMNFSWTANTITYNGVTIDA